MKTLIISILIVEMAFISNAQDHIGSFEFDGYEREYEVYLPQDFQANMPLIMSLHGITETVEWYKTYTAMHEVADTMGYVIVYPQGIGKSWNIGLTVPGYYFPDTDDIGFISSLIDTAKIRWDIDLSRVYCCGYSLGGRMSFRMAGELGHRLAAIAAVSGSLYSMADTWYPIQPMPVLYMHGTSDTKSPYEGEGIKWSAQRTIAYWLENNQCTATADTFTFPDIVPDDGCTIQKISYSSCSGESEVIHYKGIHMGHSWPGSQTTFASEGNKNLDINANYEIMTFFRRFENPLTNMAYSKSLAVYPFNIHSPSDTITIRAKVLNPENHSVEVFAFIHDEEFTFEDSIRLYDDGLHDDGDSSDNIWGNLKVLDGLSEDAYIVDLLTHDVDLGTEQFFYLPARFVTYGPLGDADYSPDPTAICNTEVPEPGKCFLLKLILTNHSSTATAKNISAELISLDTMASFNTQFSISNFQDIPASESVTSDENYWLNISVECPENKEIPIEVVISSYDHICWRDTFSITVSPLGIEKSNASQIRIYPNPVADILTIETEHPGDYLIRVNSLSGQLLGAARWEGTTHQLDLSSFEKGVYFITIRSKDFVTTRKISKL